MISTTWLQERNPARDVITRGVVGTEAVPRPTAIVAGGRPGVPAALGEVVLGVGCRLTVIDDGAELLAAVGQARPDLVVLGMDLPGVDAIEVCRRLRRRGSTVPIAILVPNGDPDLRVAGLDAGADDLITVPIVADELAARVRALLRRGGFGSSPRLAVGDIELHTARREVRRGGQIVSLTVTEYAILELLLRNADIVLERATMYERIWGADLHRSSKSLDVHIGALRRKLERHGDRSIQTVRGVGFVVWSQRPTS